jgi:hypothetical protein
MQQPFDVRVTHGLQAFPPRTRTRLTWNKGLVVNNVGAIFGGSTLEPTFLYNLDGGGASSIPFFGELSTIYRYYRVRRWHLKVHFSTLETFNILCYLLPINFAPNYANWQVYLSNPLVKHKQLGPLTGMGVGTLGQNASVETFGGSRDTGTDDLYSGTSAGGAPTNNVYHAIGITSPSGTVFVNGCTVSIFITVEVDFFELATPAT